MRRCPSTGRQRNLPEPWQRTSPLGVLFFFTKAIKRLIGNTLQMVTSAGAVVVFMRSDQMGLAGLVLVAIVGPTRRDGGLALLVL